MKRKTDSIRVRPHTRWALKLAGARLDCSIIEVLARVEQGDRKALGEWQRAAKEVSK
jgi:hypothetical protein